MDSDGFTLLNITIPEFPTLVFNATGNDKINANIESPTGISAIQIQNSTYAVITSLDTSKITIKYYKSYTTYCRINYHQNR